MNQMDFGGSCAIFQGLIASAGLILNAYFLYIATKSVTMRAQLYTTFICLFQVMMIIHCITILISFPLFFFDTNKESIIYSYFSVGLFSKRMLIIHLLFSEIKFILYPCFFIVRYCSFQVNARSDPIINLASILLAVSGFAFLVCFYYGPYIIYNDNLPFNSTQYSFSLDDSQYIRYDTSYYNIDLIYALTMFFSRLTLVLFYMLSFSLLVSINHEIGIYIGSAHAQNSHRNTVKYIFYQVTITFACLLPFYTYEIVISMAPHLYSHTLGLLFYSLRPIHVVIVPFLNCKIKQWREALRIHNTRNAVAQLHLQNHTRNPTTETRF